MSTQQLTTGHFRTDLVTMLPRLRVYALSLARNPDRADDLVQRTVVNSLAGRKSFRPGSNFAAWLFRIQRNEFVSGLRRERSTVPLDDVIANTLSHPPLQESGLVMREFKNAFDILSNSQRKTLLLAVLEGYSYDRIATHTGVSVGTVKARVSRARARLRRILTGEDTSPRTPSHAVTGISVLPGTPVSSVIVASVGGATVANVKANFSKHRSPAQRKRAAQRDRYLAAKAVRLQQRGLFHASNPRRAERIFHDR